MRKNQVVENPIKPYTLTDLIQLKTGSIIGGFGVYRKNGAMPAPEWYVSDPNTLEFILRSNSYPIEVIPEKGINGVQGVHWREKFKDKMILLGNTKVYNLSEEEFAPFARDAKFSSTMLNFEYEKPVGLYMGYIVRTGGMTFVNIFTREGFDIWI